MRAQAQLRHFSRLCAPRDAAGALHLTSQRSLELLTPPLLLCCQLARLSRRLARRLGGPPRRRHLLRLRLGVRAGGAQLRCQLAAPRLGGLAPLLCHLLPRRRLLGGLLVRHPLNAQHLAASSQVSNLSGGRLPRLRHAPLPLGLRRAQALGRRALALAATRLGGLELALQAAHLLVLLQWLCTGRKARARLG